MKFDDYIKIQEQALGIINEQQTGVQDSNVVKQFYKNLKTALSGGKPELPPKIVLKKPKDVSQLRTILSPKYDVAVQRLQSNSEPIINSKVNENLIVVNLVKIFETAGLKTNVQSETDVYNLLDKDPDVTGSSSKAGNKPVFDPKDLTSLQIIEQVKNIVEPALKLGILKWEVQAREFSPKDLFNRLVNKSAGAIQQTAGSLLSQDTFARM